MTTHDLPILLERGSGLPLAAQLAAALRRAILDGTLQHDQAVPSSRELAGSLRVSRGTVVAAYDQLAGEGYLLARPGSATRVMLDRHEALTGPAATAASALPLERPKPDGSQAPTPPPLIDLSPGHPSTRSLVDPAWTAAWRSAVSASGRSDSPEPEGIPGLRKAISEHVRRARGLACRPEDVIVTAGTSDALAAIALALVAVTGTTAPRIGVEDPGYPTARRVLQRMGALLTPVRTAEHGIDLAELSGLRPAPHAVLVTPSHQYPLGSSLPVQTRLDLLAWARDADALVIEDDYDSEFRFGTSPLPALATLDTSGRVALVGSFSKTVTPWIRCGYIVAGGALGVALREVRRDLGPSVSGVQQAALAHYLGSGGLARNVTRARREYVHRRALVLDRLGTLSGVRLSGQDGGLHVVVHTDPAAGADASGQSVADASALVAAAAARGVRVVSLADYAVRGGGQHGLGQQGLAQHDLGQHDLGQHDLGQHGRGQHGLVLGYGAVTDLELGRALDVLVGLLTPAAAR